MKDNNSSWNLFLISIGLLFVMFAPKTNKPMVMIIGGLIIVLIGVILFNKSKRKESKKND